MDSEEIIKQNAKGIDGTFVSKLNKGVFDQKAFWVLFDALNLFSEESKIRKTITINLASDYSKVQCFIHNAVSCHYNSNDSFLISNIDEDFSEYARRLTTLFSSLGEGNLSDDDFDDDLQRPKP